MLSKSRALLGVSALVVATAAVVGWRFAIFILPFSWTAEPTRLAELLDLKAGYVVADIGAGSGALAVEMAHRVGPGGVVYATELDADRQRDIARRASAMPQVRMVEAATDKTNLPDACCHAVYLRTVFHHVDDKPSFAREVSRAVRPGGRVAVIDFAPGALWFLGRDHGVGSNDVRQAFESAGLTLVERVEKWGGGMYLLLFERRG